MKIGYYLKKYMPRCLYPLYINYKYRNTVGKKCNLRNPRTFTEKIQWCKLYRVNPIITELSDKVAVRRYVADRIGEEYLVPIIGKVYSTADEIDFDKLPDSFVIKANHGSGFNIIVNNKKELDTYWARNRLNIWLKTNFAYNMLEPQYKDIQPKIYIEENLLDKVDNGSLADYKFFCFSGQVYCLYAMTDTFPNHQNSKLGIFDRNFDLMPYYREDFEPIKVQLEKPKNYELMVDLAEKLSAGFSHVRVDLYNVDGKIYFGEMTFTTESGFFKHVPEEFDEILGDQWDIKSGI